jgi:hypothetical protein
MTAKTEDRVIVRTINAGVFFGTLTETNLAIGTVTLKNSRRLHYWDGAATLSELATEGTAKPKNCKFPCPIEKDHQIREVIEIIPVTERAAKSIDAVSTWSAHA